MNNMNAENIYNYNNSVVYNYPANSTPYPPDGSGGQDLWRIIASVLAFIALALLCSIIALTAGDGAVTFVGIIAPVGVGVLTLLFSPIR